MNWIAILVSVGAGIAASMGLGGGFVLLVYLSAVAGIAQMEAQWINLLFFVPIAGFSLWMHCKNKLVETKAVWPMAAGGAAGAVAGVFLAGMAGDAALTRIFAVFLLAAGCREFFAAGKKK